MFPPFRQECLFVTLFLHTVGQVKLVQLHQQGIFCLIAIMYGGWKVGYDDTEPMDTSEYSSYWHYEAECGIWHRTEV